MNYNRKFEDDGFIYELTVLPAVETEVPTSMHEYSQEGFCCRWTITGKQTHIKRQVAVTDDHCEVIVYNSVEAAVQGAKDFLSI